MMRTLRSVLASIQIFTLSLHDALPIYLLAALQAAARREWHDTVWQMCEALWAFYHTRKHYNDWIKAHELGIAAARRCGNPAARSEEHTSELQSLRHLVCRLLLEKKKSD